MPRYRDAALFSFLALAWGGSFTAIEVGLTAYPPVLLAALRFDLGAATLLAYLFAVASDPWPRTRSDRAAVAVGGVLFVGANGVFLFLGQARTTGGVAAIVYSLVPVLTAAFAGRLLDDARLTARDYAGVGFGLLGVVLVARPGPGAVASGEVAVGVAFVFAAVVSVALGSVLIRRARAAAGPVTVTAWSLAVGAVVLHAVSAALGEPLVVSTAPRQVVAMLFLAVVATSLAHGVYFLLLDRVGPFQINLISYVVPVVATVVGWALLGERVSPLSVAGFVAILLGFVVVKREALRAELSRL